MRVSLRVRTVQKQQVVMQVQVECTTETLNQCHRACLTCLSTEACLLDHPTRQATIDQSQHATHHRWPIRKQKSQRNRNAQHPLTYRLIREYLIHQQGCTFSHSTRTTTRAEPSAFAAKQQQMLTTTTLTPYSKETVLGTTTLQIRLEFLLYIAR